MSDQFGVTRILGAEKGIQASLPLDPPMRVTAAIDRLDQGNGLVVIVDYKSGRGISRADVANGRRLQLQLYGYLGREETGAERIIARYAWLDPNIRQWHIDSSKEGDDAILKNVVEVAGQVRSSVESGDFRVFPHVQPCPRLLLLQAHLQSERVQPMEMGLTTEQAAIVTHRGSDVLVTAGAGSGKTHVLVERYLSLLKDCRIPEIAAVTFTDAAATEMRERVRREVQERSDLQDHRKDLDEAAIGTFHSLCLRILRDHPVESALDPATRVLGEDEAELELMESCIDALEEAAQADDHPLQGAAGDRRLCGDQPAAPDGKAA